MEIRPLFVRRGLRAGKGRGKMRRLATMAQMKEMDRIAIQERGIPSLELMERAAQAVAKVAADLAGVGKTTGEKAGKVSGTGLIFASSSGTFTKDEERELEELQNILESKQTASAPRVGVFCGPGNNGGDGVAAARILLEQGCQVRAFLVGDRAKMTPDERAMEEKLVAAGGNLEPFDPSHQPTMVWLSTCDCLVDALFGVGLKRPLEGDFLAVVEWLNRQHAPVVACDIPSGLHGDTGAILGQAVRAAVTVTFSYPKPGLYLGEGRTRSGRVKVARIGIPHEVSEQVFAASGSPVGVMERGIYVLPARPRTAHKGDFGKLFLLCGSQGYTGAPVLAAQAAVRTGAGLVFLGVPPEIYPIVAVKCDEAMPFPLPDSYEEIIKKARSCDVALIGPGLGRKPETEQLVLRLLADLEIPVVLDADGINACAGHIDSLDKRSALTVLTPHDGEFQRLTGCELPIQDRLTAARNFARDHGCVLVLKGHATVTAAPDGTAWVNATGNPGMAKGGSGDVLAGMVASLLGQKHLQTGYPAEWVARAVCYHGMAGDRCARELGEYAMTPSDLIEALPRLLREQEENGKW